MDKPERWTHRHDGFDYYIAEDMDAYLESLQSREEPAVEYWRIRALKAEALEEGNLYDPPVLVMRR